MIKLIASLPRWFVRGLFRRLLYRSTRQRLAYLRADLRVSFDPGTLTTAEERLLNANVAYDKRGAARLLQRHPDLTIEQIVERYRPAARGGWRERLINWMRHIEGSDTLEAAETAQRRKYERYR